MKLLKRIPWLLCVLIYGILVFGPIVLLMCSSIVISANDWFSGISLRKNSLDVSIENLIKGPVWLRKYFLPTGE